MGFEPQIMMGKVRVVRVGVRVGMRVRVRAKATSMTWASSPRCRWARWGRLLRHGTHLRQFGRQTDEQADFCWIATSVDLYFSVFLRFAVLCSGGFFVHTY
jgi:hypothetical protein